MDSDDRADASTQPLPGQGATPSTWGPPGPDQTPTLMNPVLPPQQPSYPAAQSPTWGAPPPQQYPVEQPTYPFAPPPGPAPAPRPRNRRALVATSLVTALVLISGLIVWLAQPGSSGSVASPAEQVGPAVSPQQAPFNQAADALADLTGVHYKSSGSDSESGIDVQVTGNGEAVGHATYLGQQFQLLVVGGVSYLKVPPAVIDQLPASVPKDQLKDRWITGDDALANQLPQIAWEPWRLAMAVRGALNDPATQFPAAGAPAVTVGGVPALRALTPKGAVYISQTAPYRVLRLDPKQTVPASAGADGGPTSPSSSASGPTSAAQNLDQKIGPPNHAEAGSDPTDSTDNGGGTDGTDGSDDGTMPPADTDFPQGFDQFDVQPLDEPATNGLYDQVTSDAQQLSQAADVGISITLNGKVDSSCSDGGCTVTANVTDKVASSNDKAQVQGGQVGADMTATVSIEGTPGGSCTVQNQPLPLNGTGSLSCSIPGAGGVFAAADAKNKEAAEAGAAPGSRYTWETRWYAEAQVYAVAHVNVQEEVDELGKEKQDADKCPKSSPVVQDALGGTGPFDATSSSGNPVIPPARPPIVDNPWLQNQIDPLYKGVGDPAQEGDGTTMASASSEANGGPKIHGGDHLAKSRQTLAAINRILREDTIKPRGKKAVANPKTARDRAVAEELKKALSDGLAGNYHGYQNYDLLKGC